MAKKQQRKTPINELTERLQKLNQRRLQAYQAGVGYHIIEQLDRMIQETEIDLYTTVEIEKYRNQRDDEDGEQWIV